MVNELKKICLFTLLEHLKEFVLIVDLGSYLSMHDGEGSLGCEHTVLFFIESCFDLFGHCGGETKILSTR